METSEPAVEFRFPHDAWSTSVFIALVRRRPGPYRYRSQRRTSVVVKVAPSLWTRFWPEFQQVNATLRSHLDTVTTRIIQEAIHHGGADVEERPMREPAGHVARSRE